MRQQFEVIGMTCSHCTQAVTDAVQTVDPAAGVTIDLATGHVEVLSTQPRQDLIAAIENAGYQAQ